MNLYIRYSFISSKSATRYAIPLYICNRMSITSQGEMVQNPLALFPESLVFQVIWLLKQPNFLNS